jgi:peptide/nickel transport system permease protein
VLAYVSRRFLYAIITLLLVSVTVYLIFAFLPFDPAALTCGQHCTKLVVAANRHRLGYDQPIYMQYLHFLQGIFVGRDYGTGGAAFHCPAPAFGYSFNENRCVTEMLGQALPITLSLAIGALILWLIVGVGLGVIAARFRNRWPDTLSSIFVLFGISLPVFVSGLFLLIWMTIKWHIIPLNLNGYVSIFSDPYGFFLYFILPWITLAFNFAAVYTRYTRSTILETQNEDYIRTAKAKGITDRKILIKHTLRALIAPIATMASLDFASLIGGAILTESIYNLPGLGRLSISSVFEFDLPVLVATTLVSAAVVIFMNLIVDLLYAVLDPRVRI